MKVIREEIMLACDVLERVIAQRLALRLDREDVRDLASARSLLEIIVLDRLAQQMEDPDL